MYKATLAIVAGAAPPAWGRTRRFGHRTQLSPTAHQPLPRGRRRALARPGSGRREPTRARRHTSHSSTGPRRSRAGDYAGALPLVSQASLASTDLRDYAAYYTAAVAAAAVAIGRCPGALPRAARAQAAGLPLGEQRHRRGGSRRGAGRLQGGHRDLRGPRRIEDHDQRGRALAAGARVVCGERTQEGGRSLPARATTSSR